MGLEWNINTENKKNDNTNNIDEDGSGNSETDRNLKRYRRTAGEIARKYTCWCGKAYGSEGSLNQHKKLKKHFEGDYQGQNEENAQFGGDFNEFGPQNNEVF